MLVVFFVAVGTSLRLDTLVSGGRGGASASASTRLAADPTRRGSGPAVVGRAIRRPGRHLWTGLISQAGITLGLASALAAEHPTWGRPDPDAAGGAHRRGRAGRARSSSATAWRGPARSTRRRPRPLLVVSNREPYLHNKDLTAQITMSPATGGVAVALDALMRERGGVWIAHGAGTADREMVDADDKVRVPPDRPAYQLRRLWLEPEEFAAYYGGFANEGLWPLCHLVDVRPKFRAEDWAAYQSVNAQFAAAIDQELPHVRRAGVHPGLPPDAGGAVPSRAAPDDAYRPVLAHPVAVPRSAADLPVAARDPRGAAGQRPARLPGRARPSQLRARRAKTSWAPRSKPMARVCASTDGRRRSSRCRSAWTTTASRAW